MRQSYLELYEGGQGELTEKRSRFIATVRPVKSEEEAAAFIEETRKKYWDAFGKNCRQMRIIPSLKRDNITQRKQFLTEVQTFF